ncbi:hypothetical protein POVCU1_029020 [Plasmodium ovale curtisi]|uniref:Uncharacterized protein n=1 Tax=Plasmodium ovale curtisi TaxID=864141 RepID=A0A1A8WRR0_PLAOA|nr:hypothetical protein POVCU1_029020 [Plasmodium ovale curtisi]
MSTFAYTTSGPAYQRKRDNEITRKIATTLGKRKERKIIERRGKSWKGEENRGKERKIVERRGKSWNGEEKCGEDRGKCENRTELQEWL